MTWRLGYPNRSQFLGFLYLVSVALSWNVQLLLFPTVACFPRLIEIAVSLLTPQIPAPERSSVLKSSVYHTRVLIDVQFNQAFLPGRISQTFFPKLYFGSTGFLKIRYSCYSLQSLMSGLVQLANWSQFCKSLCVTVRVSASI